MAVGICWVESFCLQAEKSRKFSISVPMRMRVYCNSPMGMYSQDIFSRTDDILGIVSIRHLTPRCVCNGSCQYKIFFFLLNRWECYLHRPQCHHCTKAIDVDDNTKLPTYGMRDIFMKNKKLDTDVSWC